MTHLVWSHLKAAYGRGNAEERSLLCVDMSKLKLVLQVHTAQLSPPPQPHQPRIVAEHIHGYDAGF